MYQKRYSVCINLNTKDLRTGTKIYISDLVDR